MKNRLSTKVAAKEINYVEDPGTVNERVAQKFRCFKEDDISLKERSERPSDLEDEVLLQMVELKPSTSIRKFLAKLDPSQSTINQHLSKLSFVNWRWNT